MFADRLPAASAWPDAVFDDLVGDNPPPDPLRLYSHGKPVDHGVVRAGHWGVAKDEGLLDLGRSVDLLVLARRPKAIDTSAGEHRVVYDPFDPEFARIRRRSADPDAGAMFGVSFLVFERTSRRLYELFLGTRSTRPLAKALFDYLPLTAQEIGGNGLRQGPRRPRPVTLTSTLRASKPAAWYVPELRDCSSWPDADRPDFGRLVPDVLRFLNQ